MVKGLTMSDMQTSVEGYLKDGCLRCPLGGTADCKAQTWQKELRLLRSLVLACGLNEEVKWGVPCYTYKNSNVLIISALKDNCVLSFFKGVLLQDEKHLLEKPGEHTQSDRVIRFKSAEEIAGLENTLKAYIYEAIEVEKAGLKATSREEKELVYPDELLQKMEVDPQFREAFENLTPGRKRSYIIHISGAKQAKTRTSRVEKCVPKVLEGKGFNER